jgi:hypothetical protein
MPNLFTPGEEMQPEVPAEQAAWGQAESPQQPQVPDDESRPPWELGGLP